MPEMTSYPPGTPNWVDLTTPDVDAAVAFYRGLFGWDAFRVPDPAAGGYTILRLREKPVAAVAPGDVGDAERSMWDTYICVTDVEETLRRAVDQGAKVVSGPIDVLTAGRSATIVDPVGTRISLWQPGYRAGLGVVDEPGAMCWNELTVRDAETAGRFYQAVFGWRAEPRPMGGITYTEWSVGGRTFGGLMPMDDSWPDLPSHWMVYFAVADCDATAARTRELGGTVSVPPTDIPPGRFAVLNDPSGAVFSIITRPADKG